VAGGAIFLIINSNNNDKSNLKISEILTIEDLEDPNVNLSPNISDASIGNLADTLKDKIDEQITAKENPIETVKQLSGVLSNTTNEKRQDQLSNFLDDFLTNYEDSLWLANGYKIPDQAQVNFWKAELYSYLIHHYQRLMDTDYLDVDGKPLNTTKEQLRYIEMYLNLANDPNSHIVISEKDKGIITDYEYNEADDFLDLKSQLMKRTVQ